MATAKCCAPGCGNLYTSRCETSFFRFPSETVRCQKWIHFCGLEYKYRLASEVPLHIKLCIKHFNESDYYTNGRKKFLKKTAVPTIHSTVIEQQRTQQNDSPLSLPAAAWSRFRRKVVRTDTRRAKCDSSKLSSQGQGKEASSVSIHISSPNTMFPRVQPSLKQHSADIKKEETHSFLEANIKQAQNDVEEKFKPLDTTFVMVKEDPEVHEKDRSTKLTIFRFLRLAGLVRCKMVKL